MLIFARRILLVFALCACLNCLAQGGKLSASEDFRKFGDIFRFLPIYVGVISGAMGDWEGVGELALGTLSTQAATEALKYTFSTMHENGNSVSFAKRPCCDSYKGMPSGHSSGAFSGAFYVYYRYGWKPALPALGIATLVAASRVDARRHSVAQVSVGAAISLGFAYLFTSDYYKKEQNLSLLPIIEPDKDGKTRFAMSVNYKF